MDKFYSITCYNLRVKNNIPVSQIRVGDTVLYKTGVGMRKRDLFLKIKSIKDVSNGTKRLMFDKRREMVVLNRGEVTITFDENI